MKIAIVGYGKMGKMVERVATSRGHEIVARFDIDNNPRGEGLTAESLEGVDVAIEFSTPETVVENLRRLIELRIPTVVGTTGWYARLDEIKQLAADHDSALVYSANFSIGMNLFFRIVREAAALFARHAHYDPFLVEAHHKFKKDAPSGTALVIAKLMRESYGERAPEAVAIRAGHIPGTHEVGFDSEADTITLTHTARSREGFAAGAVLAAERSSANKAFTNFQNCFLNRTTLGARAAHVRSQDLKGENKMANLDQFRGCGTAIVTPFQKDESIDEPAFRRLVNFQIENGVDFIVACGTTGESVTMSDDEQARVVELTIEESKGRAPVVAGAGGYNTREVIEKVRRYERLGADAILSVTPYYNKPTQEGLYQHYRAIAESTSLPIILYSVQGRTACNIEPATVERLAGIENIVGIKEASGNITQIAEIASLVDEGFKIFAGDDMVVLPVAALGGVGVVSVASNLLPRQVSDLCHASVEGRFDEARKLNHQLTPIFKALFIESNPIPVKAALAMTGMIEEVYRLPLTPMNPSNRLKLEQVLTEAGVLAKVSKQATS